MCRYLLLVVKWCYGKRITGEKTNSIKGYDYSNEGYYFITICTHGQQYLLCNVITASVGQSPRPTILDIICTYKSITTKRYNKTLGKTGKTLWQSRYHDHIIRNEAEYHLIWKYIVENLIRWDEDTYYV